MSIQSEINRIAGAKSDIADAIEDKGVTVPSGTKLDGMANLIGQISGGSGKLNSTQAADAYDPTATYAVGDKVSYAGNVYSCISAISTPEAWDSTHWDQVDPIQDQVDDVRNTLTQLETNVGKILPVITGTTNNSGYIINSKDYFEANGVLYKATANIPQNSAWAASAVSLSGTAINDAVINLDLIQGKTAGIKSIAVDADLCPNGSVRWFDLRNTNTSDLPTGAMYGTARVNKRNSTAITITVYDEYQNIYFTTFGGSAWTAWKQVSLVNV